MLELSRGSDWRKRTKNAISNKIAISNGMAPHQRPEDIRWNSYLRRPTIHDKGNAYRLVYPDGNHVYAMFLFEEDLVSEAG
jgi:hypothetical protein